MSSPSADRNLLLGIIALQMDFVSRDELVEGMNAWVLQKSTSLGEILRKKQLLDEDSHQLLEALVQKHLQQHGNDPQKSLAAVSSIKSVRQDLEQLADPDVAASLVHVSQNSPAVDPYATQAGSVGDSTSKGTRFRILRPHAKGGLGQVSVALDEELRREVALKEIQPEHAHRDESRGRFLVEAEVTGGLEHPGIVPVYGLGTYADGRPYYAMRFIRGDSLKAAIERFHSANWSGRDSDRTLELRKLLGRFVDVCNAIAYAHSRGVLHRDLKPGNIMLGNYGETLVVDWGLAKVIGQPEQTNDSDNSTERPLSVSGSGSAPTIAGSALGTPAYMSPEQAEGRLDELGPTTDVYSLGATLYHLLTGKPPIESQEIGDILARTVKGDIRSPREVSPHIPRPLTAICQKATALKPKDRYQSPRDLAEDVERFLADEPISALREPLAARMARVSRKHRGVVLASMAALVLITVGAITAAVLIDEQRDVAEKLAEEKSELASKNATLAESEKAARTAEEKQRQIAERKRKDAEEAQKKERAQREQAEHQLYLSQIYRAAGDLEAGRNGQAHELLTSIPFDQRQWEAKYLIRQAEGTPLTLRGHTHSVASVAFSPDGRRIASGSFDKTIKVWDAQTGEEILTLRGHNGSVLSVAFSLDGRRIVSGSYDKTVKVWDAQTGVETLTLQGHTREVLSVAFSLHGRRIISGSEDRTVKVWDAQTGVELVTCEGHTNGILRAVFSPDGQRIVSGSYDNTVKVWDAQKGAELLTLQGHSERVFTVAFSPDGRRIVSGSLDQTAKVWDAQTGVELLTFREHTKGVMCAAFSPDSRRIVSGSDDHTIKVWDVSTGAELLTLRGHTDVVWSAAFSPDGRRIVSGSNDDTIKVWNAERGVNVLTLKGHADDVYSAVFSPDGSHIVSGSKDGTAKVWDAQTGLVSQTLEDRLRGIMSVTYSPDGHQIVLDWRDGTMVIRDARTGVKTHTLWRHLGSVTSVDFSPDGRQIVSASSDGKIKLWEASSGKEIRTLKANPSMAYCVKFSPDSCRIVSGHHDTTVTIWDVQTGAEIRKLRGHTDQVNSVDFSPDGHHIISGGRDKTVKVWDVQTGTEIRILRGHTDWVESVDFSPDGCRIVSGSADKTVKVWDVQTGTEILTLRGHTDDVMTVAFSRDGQRIVSGSGDGKMKIWDARIRAEILALQGHTGRVVSAGYATDGLCIVSRDTNDAQFLWDVNTGKRLVGESIPELQNGTGLSPDGLHCVVPHDEKVLLIRKKFGYDPWAEDKARLEATAASYHGNQADSAVTEQHWFSAVFHLRQLMQFHPEKHSHNYGLALIGLRDTASFRTHCRKWLERIDGSSDVRVIDDLTWLATLAPDAGVKPGVLRELAERAANSEPDSWPYNETLGAAYYREGNFDKAVEQLNRAIELRGKDGATVWMKLFLAMAHHRFGEMKKAQTFLNDAVRQIETTKDAGWQEKLRHETLRREAEALITPDTPKPAIAEKHE